MRFLPLPHLPALTDTLLSYSSPLCSRCSHTFHELNNVPLWTLSGYMPFRASSATGRAQRASARNQTATALPTEPTSSTECASGSGAQPVVVYAEPSGSATGDDEPTLSRSNSTSNLQEAMMPHTTSGKGGKKDKGKGKEAGTSTPPMRVKEEPNAVALPTPEPPSNLVRPA